MSKNTNLSFLTDYITADITNGRIGINTPSPTVAFDVTGATKITGVLTLTSTISNGTYAYTLPSATGTLALTSALSGYLPLTGGTLTGALSGTSATFNHNDAPTIRIQRNGGTDSNTVIEFTNASRSFFIGSNGTSMGLGGTTGAISSQPLQIASTGAATFSSSVSATSLRSSAVGTFGFNTANNGEFQIYATAADGLVMAGRGSTNDFVLVNKTGSNVFEVPTGTINTYFRGNVGIGTSSPRIALEVVGTDAASSSTLTPNGAIMVGNPTVSNSQVMTMGVVNGASNHAWIQSRNSTTANFYTLALNPSGGNVGIGTTSPDAPLDVVRGSTGTVATFGIKGLTTNPRLRIDADETNNTVTLNPNYNGATSPSLVFKTQEAERMRITSAGNVGIGTSSPSFALDVASTSADSFRINRTGVAGTGSASSMSFQVTQSNGQSATLGSISGEFMSNWGGDLRFYTKPANGTPNDSVTERMRITSGGDVILSYSKALAFNSISNQYITGDASFLTLGTGNTSRLAITVGGNVLIGTTSDNGYKLQVSGNIYASGAMYSNSSIYAVGGIGSQAGIVIDYGYAYGLNSNNQVAANAWYMQVSTSWSNGFRFFYGGTSVGTGAAKANIDTAGNYSVLSDISKKKDIALSTLGLSKILLLKPSTFKFKDDEKEEEQLGFIAQEVRDIIPQAYYEDGEGDDKFIGLTYSSIIPVLVKAIQELSAEITILKNK